MKGQLVKEHASGCRDDCCAAFAAQELSFGARDSRGQWRRNSLARNWIIFKGFTVTGSFRPLRSTASSTQVAGGAGVNELTSLRSAEPSKALRIGAEFQSVAAVNVSSPGDKSIK